MGCCREALSLSSATMALPVVTYPQSASMLPGRRHRAAGGLALRVIPGIRLLLWVLWAVAISGTTPGPTSGAIAGTGQPIDMVADVIARVQPSVVRVVVVRPPPKPNESDTKLAGAAESGPVSSSGSGFAIASGLVATNRHVVEDAVSIFVSTADGARYQAEIVGMASKADIAVLRIDSNAHLPALALGD